MHTPWTDWLDNPHRRPLWRWALLLLMAVICWLAFTPKPPTLGPLDYSDKLQHLLAFVTLALVASQAARPAKLNTFWVFLFLLLYGGFIEVVQTWLPPRHGDWIDLFADAMGIGVGLCMVAALRWRLRPDLPQ